MNATSAPRHPVRTLIASSLIVSLLGLSACNKNDSTSTPSAPASDAGAASAPQPASTPVAYTPPSADQLYQMVAPIALFPDKLVAQVLAGATYPDQIAAANTWVGQNPSLKGPALATAADTQPWDPSVKALTAFPAVLAQMASNPAWTTALGQAYYNDPTDVMNAIQVMRQRAQASGHLRSGSQLRITQVTPAAPANYAPAADAPVLYNGPAVIPPPEQAIEIEPTQPDVVYVPSYNPTVVYGEPVSSYPGYVYQPPAYTTGEAVAAGVVTFGIGIAVGAAIFGHHDWGWHAWGMNWGAPHRGPDRNEGWQRPAVVYNHTTYVTKSTTVVNNITHIRNTRITNNYGGNVTNNNTFERNGMRPGAEPPREQAMRPSPGTAPMTMPHFGANDTRPGARPAPNAFEQNRANAPHADASGRQAPGGPMHAPQAMQQEREQAQQRNEAQQQQQRNAMQQHNVVQQQQQRAEMQQHNEAQQQQQRAEMQQRNEAQQQQQRAEMQQRNEAQQQQQRAEMQQRNEAQQQQQRAEMQQRNEAQQQQQRVEMQQRNEAQQQQQRREMQPHPQPQPQPQQHAAPQPRQPEPAQHHPEQPQQQHDPHEHRPG